MAAVVPFSSSLAAYLWRYVHTMPVPTGYRMLATKHRWRKLDTASSRVRISEMKTSLSDLGSSDPLNKAVDPVPDPQPCESGYKHQNKWIQIRI